MQRLADRQIMAAIKTYEFDIGIVNIVFVKLNNSCVYN